ncbi:MAG: hypothetical protein A2201_03415 [Alicyclobacillus sp. RIFOXYA1_FULL_53_8]|nr:MAG: hypothetical protein A2201_03415 [Alicyclobacillus sp. RIFOXYA1_FULL_53_8]
MVSNSVSRVKVQIHGTDYTLRGLGTEEQLRAVAAQVNQVMRDIAAANPQLDQKRVAVLTAVNLADDLQRLRRQYEELMQLLDDKTQSKP